MRSTGRELCRFVVLATAVACASAPPPKKTSTEDVFVDGVRQRPLSEAEAGKMIDEARPRIVDCYMRERFNTKRALSDFEVRLKVPVDGSRAKAEIARASIPGQIMLEACVMDVLTSIHFPAHSGASLLLAVPIQGP
jgi:hypothetical protein